MSIGHARRAVVLALLLCLSFPLLTVRAVDAFELAARNDVTVDGTPSAPLTIFLAGESAASTLSSPCDGEIVAAQIYWSSANGTAAPQVEQAITFYETGAHPVPGAVRSNAVGGDAQIVGPTLVDGAMNEFRYLDPPSNTLPLGIPVTAGESFVTALTFANSTSGGASSPSVTLDQNGCTLGRNAIDLSAGGWVDACLLGSSGDFVIRAVVECSAAPSVPAMGDGGSLLLGIALTGVGLLALLVGKWLREEGL